MSQPTGRVSYSPTTRVLKVVTLVKRGKKIVENCTYYRVENLNPDVRVANQAYSLVKMELAVAPCDYCGGARPCKACNGDGDKLTLAPTGEVWHVAKRDFGPECSCPHYEFHPNGGLCKHARSMQAVGLLE